jgi:hypothetical protein
VDRNVAIGIIDLAIGVVGFWFTFLGLQRTKNALDASRHATRQTLEIMSDRLTMSDISAVQGNIREIQVALRGSRYESALIRAQATRIRLHQLRSRPGFSDDDRRAQILQMTVHLTKLEDRLERVLADPSLSFSVPSANRLLAGFVVDLAVWSEEVRFAERSTEP